MMFKILTGGLVLQSLLLTAYFNFGTTLGTTCIAVALFLIAFLVNDTRIGKVSMAVFILYVMYVISHTIIGALIIGAVLIFLICIIMKRKAKIHPNFDITENGRKISTFEKMIASEVDETGSILLSNIVFIRSKKPLTEAIIRKALELISKRHPLLQCRLVQKGEHMYLERMSEVQISLSTSERAMWKNLMEEQLLIEYESSDGPLWRVTFLPNAKYDTTCTADDAEFEQYPYECACVFGFHKIITDGPSYSRMFSELLNYLDELQKGAEPKVEPLKFLSPMEDYLKEELSETFMETAFSLVLSNIPWLKTFIIKRVRMRPNAYTAKFKTEIRKDPTIPKRTCVIPLEFSKQETSALLQACKDHGATVQGAVQTAACVAMARFMKEDLPTKTTVKRKRRNVWQALYRYWKKQQHPEIAACCTVNARPFIKDNRVPADYMGCYFLLHSSNQEIMPNCQQPKFWEMAAAATRQLKKSMKDDSLYSFMKMISKPMENGTTTEKPAYPSGRRNDLVVFTNLGNCKFLDRDESSEVALRARYGCSAEHNNGPIFANNIMSFRGKMFWTIAYYQNITSEKRAFEYAGIIRETLKMAFE